jgi:hypothetical protein
MSKYKVGEKVLYRKAVRTITKVDRNVFLSKSDYIYQLDRNEVPLFRTIGDYVAFEEELSPYIGSNSEGKHALERLDD